VARHTCDVSALCNVVYPAAEADNAIAKRLTASGHRAMPGFVGAVGARSGFDVPKVRA
jgi:hypothetical protein